MATAISAMSDWIIWYWPSTLPRTVRSLAYLMASSKQARAMPRDNAPTTARPDSSPRMMILNPSPSSPRRFTTGTTKSSRNRAAVRNDFERPMVSMGCAVKPGYFFGSTMNAVTPLAPADGSVLASRMPASHSLPSEAHILEPLRR